MSDVLDEIIDRLSPSIVKMILDLNTDSSRYSECLSSSLKEVQQIKINQIKKDLERKIVDIKSKTAENRKYLENTSKDLENLRISEAPVENQQRVTAYTMKMNGLKDQVKNLTKDFNVDLTELFNNIENLNEQIQDYKKKIAEAKSKYEYFDGFPPDIKQGKEAITKVKENIKLIESAINTFD